MSEIIIQSVCPLLKGKDRMMLNILCMNAEVNGSGAQFRVRATNFTYSTVVFYHQVQTLLNLTHVCNKKSMDIY